MSDPRSRAEDALRRLQGNAGDLLASVAALRAARKGKGKVGRKAAVIDEVLAPVVPPGSPVGDIQGQDESLLVAQATLQSSDIDEVPQPVAAAVEPVRGGSVLPPADGVHGSIEDEAWAVEISESSVSGEEALDEKHAGEGFSGEKREFESEDVAASMPVLPISAEVRQELPGLSDGGLTCGAPAAEDTTAEDIAAEDTFEDLPIGRPALKEALLDVEESGSLGDSGPFELDSFDLGLPIVENGMDGRMGLDASFTEEQSGQAVEDQNAVDLPESVFDEASEDDEDESFDAEADTPWVGLPDDQRQDFLSEMEDLVEKVADRLSAYPLPLPGTPQWEEVARHVHTLKGTANVAGANRAGWWLHRMEASMEDWGRADADELVDPVRSHALHDSLLRRFARAQLRLSQALMPQQVSASPSDESDNEMLPAAPERIQGDRVKVDASQVDRLITEANEACLTGGDIAARSLSMREQLRMHEEGIERLGRLVRDLEVQTEDQIESRRSELQTASAEFDPLELDRYTRFQELARSISEAVTDALDGHREMVRLVTEQDNAIAYQGRALQEVQSALHRTRLLPFETQQQRLEAALAAAARDLGKSVRFQLLGGMVELDRLLLDRLLSPLEHILRNAVAHGIESPENRAAAGKPEVGVVRVSIGQEPGRAHILVEDDGRGLDIDRIRAKAIADQLWDPSRPMDASEAADMVCRPKFSTASTVTQTAGRGVGMDVVRQDILRLGGTFEMRSTPGEGLVIAIQVPTTVATTSVIVASVGPERWAIPVGIIDDVIRVSAEKVAMARAEGALEDPEATQGERIPYVPLADLMGVQTYPGETAAFVLILKEGTRRLAVEVDEVSRVIEAPLRSAGPVWARVPGVVGAAILQDGSASFVVDPLRAPDRATLRPDMAPRQIVRRPLILVVDDSVTVRKAATQFLEKSGYDVATAKDGQEALEILGAVHPAAMLLDVEMPRMDGFECARNVRESSKNNNLPIIMITSRQATKHRQRAEALGVNGYLSKPFQEEELLAMLHSLAPLNAVARQQGPVGG